jgi:polyisoprenoid-binding protein YceI
MIKSFAFIALVLTGVTATAQTEWGIDNSHTSIHFSVMHMMVSEVDGSFKMFSGKITTNGDNFDDAKIEFSIDVNSVNTDNENRDKHLKSEDFFNAEKYPSITFKGTSFKKTGDNKYALEGDLAIRDVTKKVKWDVTYNGTVKDPRGNVKAGFKAITTINRLDYNLAWNKMIDAGPVVGKDVSITVNIEVNKK